MSEAKLNVKSGDTVVVISGANKGKSGKIQKAFPKTGKVIVAHEDAKSWGYGAEVAARIGDELFEYLDAPVRRIGALDTFVGYNPVLEDTILPQVATIAEAVRALHPDPADPVEVSPSPTRAFRRTSRSRRCTTCRPCGRSRSRRRPRSCG